jgi:hypothetical protein
MDIQVIQWNVSSSCNPVSIASFLQSHFLPNIPIIVCLQEVTLKIHQVISSQLRPSFDIYSLNLRPQGKREGRNRSLGIDILGFNLEVEYFDLIHRAVFPERTLDVTCAFGSKKIRVVSFHSLTGVGYKKAKPSNFASLADHLEKNADIDFLCFDANEPKVDSLYPERRVFYDNKDKGKNASLLLGPNSVHHLQDSFISFLSDKGQTEDMDPLTVSYMTKLTPRRYDYIYSSPKWQVKKVEYRYNEALNATSDHAVIIGEFHLC